MSAKNKVILIIMDGWGNGSDPAVSAIAQASTPYVDSLYEQYPNAELRTDGNYVGLPEGQMGNSEVGHINIGAGRVVYQELMRINKACEDGSLAKHALLQSKLADARAQNRKVHLMGLISDGGVHSHISHLKTLCSICDDAGLPAVYVHAFMDGRDTDPQGGVAYLEELEAHLADKSPRIASVVGRYYAMDRDQRWERTKVAYDLLLHGKGEAAEHPVDALRATYAAGVTDEFIKPIVVVNPINDTAGDASGDASKGIASEPIGLIGADDLVICFNFRTDRCRQITRVLTQEEMPAHDMATLALDYVTMTVYDNSFKGVEVLFRKSDLPMTLGEVLEQHNCTQIRIAETEKYPHVTFFFSGGREKAFEGEQRIMVPSPKVATYDLQPEMSAGEVTTAIVSELEAASADFVCLNFANADMVGHTGDMQAAISACETVDKAVQMVAETALASGYTVLVTADHGNADKLQNPDGSPNTAHTTNPVPVFLLSKDRVYSHIKDGKLADLAPTVLKIMGIPQPVEMDGEVLL